MPEISFHDQALAELAEAITWYKSETPALARRFLSELGSAKQRLLSYPEIGSPFHKGTRRIFLRNFPYALIYLREPDKIHIVAVMHSSRQPKYWRDRL